MKAIEILKAQGFKVDGDLPYCTEESGINYHVGFKDKKAVVVALIEDESIYLITKKDAKEMFESAQTAGVKYIYLVTNFGIEKHSRFDKVQKFGFNTIVKLSNLKENHFSWKKTESQFYCIIENISGETKQYVKQGLLSKTDKLKLGGTLKGLSYLLEFETELEYNEAINKFIADGHKVI